MLAVYILSVVFVFTVSPNPATGEARGCVPPRDHHSATTPGPVARPALDGDSHRFLYHNLVSRDVNHVYLLILVVNTDGCRETRSCTELYQCYDRADNLARCIYYSVTALSFSKDGALYRYEPCISLLF